MASSSNQTTDRRGREKTAAAESETIWELGPVRSRMTQNALGDHFVDQFQDNSEKEPATNVRIAQTPTVKIEPENKSASSFGDYFKKTVTAIPDHSASSATRLVHGELTGLGTTLYHQGELTGLGMYPQTLDHQGETTGLGMYSGSLNRQMNWEMRGMRGSCDPIEGIRPGSSASSSRIRGPTDLIQSRADEFSFRMGLLERENLRTPSILQGDISNPVSGFASQMTLEEIERQKQKSLMNLQQWEQAQRIELEAQKRREAMAKAREDDEMMKLIQAEQLKQDLVKQDLARQTEDCGMREKSRQEDIDRLQKEVEMLKKQMISKSPNNSAIKTNNVPVRSGVKYRLGVTARLGNPQELKKKVFDRLGQDDEIKEYMGENEDMQHGNVERRCKRDNGDTDSTTNNQYCKKRKNNSHELPADLVLTELSDAGPVPAKASGAIPRELSGVIPTELILTEFGENGPVKVQTELEKLEARARKVSKNK